MAGNAIQWKAHSVYFSPPCTDFLSELADSFMPPVSIQKSKQPEWDLFIEPCLDIVRCYIRLRHSANLF